MMYCTVIYEFKYPLDFGMKTLLMMQWPERMCGLAGVKVCRLAGGCVWTS